MYFHEYRICAVFEVEIVLRVANILGDQDFYTSFVLSNMESEDEVRKIRLSRR